MGEYTELQGCKHLLEVAQNILYSSQIDQEILSKYQQLKSSIHKKITTSSSTATFPRFQPPSPSPSLSLCTSLSDNHYIALLSTYRVLIDNAVKVVQAFQQQLQTQMQRQNFNSILFDLNSRFQQKLYQLETLTNYSISSQSASKTKLLHKEQINTLKYEYEQLESKFQNLGLLIEVHKKMHEIILQATRTQQKKLTHEEKYKTKIKQLQQQLAQVNDVKQFINQHQLTQNSYAQFVTASKALKKVLFNNYQFN